MGSLAFPAGVAPGFDPSHIAASGISLGHGFLGVALGGGFVSLLNGKAGTKVGSPTYGVKGLLGQAAHFAVSASDAFTFSGQSTANDLVSTFAAIVMFDGFSATQGIIQNDSATLAGVALRVSSTGILQFVASSVIAVSSTITLLANVPYFVAASCSAASGTVNFLARRLDNGAVFISTGIAPGSSMVPNGVYVVGNSTSANQSQNGNLAAVMFSTKYQPMASLQAWAADPWSLWYARS